MKRRIAMQATHYRLALPIFERLRDRYRASGNDDAAQKADMVARDCLWWTDAMLVAAHNPGMTHGGLPSAGELNHLRHMSNLAATELTRTDRPFMDSYLASLPPEHVRVVTSLIVTGPASSVILDRRSPAGSRQTQTPAASPSQTPAGTPPPQAAPAPVPSGWYADPAGRFELRYWDGTTWTEHVARAGHQYTDPPVA